MLTQLAANSALAHGDHMHGPPFPLFGLIFLLIIIGIFAFVWSRRRHEGRTSAQSVLADRFARGEISAEEYRSRLSELKRK